MTDTISSAASGSVPTKGCPSVVTASLPPLPGPSGLGTSAARITHEPDDKSAYVEREWGDGTAPPLHCPVVDRVDPALAEAVDDRLVDWAKDCGFTEEQSDLMRAAGFGRLAVLTHSDTVDPDRLLIAAQLNAAWWAADDLYADDTEMGASPTELPPRLALVMAAMDPVAPAGVFTAELDEALRGDPVLVALDSGIAHLSRHASPAQVQRACYATFAMFVSWNAYAAWRHTGTYPPAWKYLATRQHDSFYTSMTLIDPVGGYELDANLFYEPRVREAVTQAGTATVLVNDLVSVAKDAADENPVCNMVLQIAADRDCSIEEATVVTVELHNRIVRDFEANRRALRSVPSPQLHRYLRAVRSWMGGGAEWHITNPRYRSA
ncbi:family 2 encapsulin nanocompartment cargo protein terpene cyclase [Labedaea rhizosphaerae]|uniref:Terpene synthase n=1 Tax=Labedaea rhizosphaerae TaxID=598644 RepID=A0A4R6RTC5_LABRH|nr:family 2 encapsulin nanocompartment cargo protein terpene cyclase [Labedaea rhizosphaerae]TDP90004.1 2-methylisoborneol synthase [Labedaea rhizosphaerae]